MEIKACVFDIDHTRRELQAHGTPEFPCAAYETLYAAGPEGDMGAGSAAPRPAAGARRSSRGSRPSPRVRPALRTNSSSSWPALTASCPSCT